MLTVQAFQAAVDAMAEDRAQGLARQEEMLLRWHPVRMIGGKTAAGNEAVDMRMEKKILAPGVQDADQADFGAKVCGVGGNLQQRAGAGMKE